MGLKKDNGKYGYDVGKEISSFPPTPKGLLGKFFLPFPTRIYTSTWDNVLTAPPEQMQQQQDSLLTQMLKRKSTGIQE